METDENVCLFVFISLFASFGVYVQYFFDSKKFLIKLIERRSKVQENKTSCESTAIFTNEKHFLNYIRQ